MTYLARVASGLEAIAKSEIEKNFEVVESFPGGVVFRAAEMVGEGHRGSSADSVTLTKLRWLRSIDNLYAFVCRRNDGDLTSPKYLEGLVPSLAEGTFSSAVKVARLWNSSLSSRDEKHISFRVSCERRHSTTKRKHGFSSMQAAAALGSSVVAETEWKVSMKDFDIEVLLWLLDADVIVALSLFYPSRQESKDSDDLESATPSKKQNVADNNPTAAGHDGEKNSNNKYRWVTERQLYALRSYRSALVPTSLKPSTAYSLCCLAQITRKDLVLDPMCGSGMIPLEAATGLGGQAMAGDMHHIAVDAADKNTQIANRDFKAACDVLRWDAANLPLREGMIDAYVSDFPFGQRCGSPKVRVQLYQNSMRELARILRPGTGRAVILLLWRKAPGILRSTFGNWLAVENSFQIDMEGLIAEVMILKRTPSPAPKPMRQTRCERDAKRQWRPTADSTTAQAADAV